MDRALGRNLEFCTGREQSNHDAEDRSERRRPPRSECRRPPKFEFPGVSPCPAVLPKPFQFPNLPRRQRQPPSFSTILALKALDALRNCTPLKTRIDHAVAS